MLFPKNNTVHLHTHLAAEAWVRINRTSALLAFISEILSVALKTERADYVMMCDRNVILYLLVFVRHKHLRIYVDSLSENSKISVMCEYES